MYCCVLVVGHFVWECEGVSRKWRTELKCTAVGWQLDILCGSVRGSAGSGVLNRNVLLCVGSWTFCMGV